MNKKVKQDSTLLTKTSDSSWNKLISAASGAIKKIPKNKIDLIALAFTTPLDYMLAANKGILKQKLISDISKLVEAGELDENFLNDDLTRSTFAEIAEIIDKDNPTMDKVDAMVALLKVVADKNETHRYESSIHLSTLRKIDSVELNILITCYRIRKEIPEFAQGIGLKHLWRTKIIEYMKWDENMIYQIEMREAHLEELRLIDSSPGQDRNNINATVNFRLTGLGVKIGDILTGLGPQR